jgi:hypothetical protein
LNGTHSVNKPLIKFRKSFELSSRAVYNHWKIHRVVISYWDLRFYKEYKNILLLYNQLIIVFTGHKRKKYLQWFKIIFLKTNFALDFTPWRIWSNIWIPLRKETESVSNVVDASSRVDIDSLKIQDNEEETLTILSGSGNSSISDIKLTSQFIRSWSAKNKEKSRD